MCGCGNGCGFIMATSIESYLAAKTYLGTNESQIDISLFITVPIFVEQLLCTVAMEKAEDQSSECYDSVSFICCIPSVMSWRDCNSIVFA